jgi:L-seryl-tRNA(Ser) seleniumtransferase
VRTLPPSSPRTELLRKIPSVDELLLHQKLGALAARIERQHLVEITRSVLSATRARIISEEGEHSVTHSLSIDPDNLVNAIVVEVEQLFSPSLRPVINATGVILHTNLGRAPLFSGIAAELLRSAAQYSNLEYDLVSGSRGKRDIHIAKLIQRLTGAESAIVVNNCAAAVLITLAALAKNREVIVSRGELVEIGGGFRIPEVMEQSGALLREVGTTNRTRIADYENAINEKTCLLLRVHPSNFKISGFTERATAAELAALSQRSGIPLVEDLGSGCLEDLSRYGIREPTVRQSVEAGFSLVLFSGDKLLGGPQAGIIAGKNELVAKIRRHPLFRALRVDKLTLAALQVTLAATLRGAWEEIPALRMIRIPLEEIARRAEQFLSALRAQLSPGTAHCEIVDGNSLVGGGSTPEQSIPTKLINIRSANSSATQLEQRLRLSAEGIPVIARVEDDALVFDLRTVFPEQGKLLESRLIAALR